jgi:predicted TIM-barrel enzyme
MLAEVVDTIPTIYLTPFLVTLHPAVKAIITIVLDTVVSLVVHAEMLPSGVSVISNQSILAAIVSVATSIAVYLGLYVPAKLSNRPDGVLGPTVGIGPKVKAV